MEQSRNPCDSLKRQPIDTYVSPEKEKSLFVDVKEPLPLYELKLQQYVRNRYYSLNNNELLRCRWKRYKYEYFTRKKVPFRMPQQNDIHFYKYLCHLKPSESIGGPGTDYRRKLTFYHKVDEKGVTPVPVEAHVRQTKQRK